MAPGAANVTPSVELFGSRTRPAFDELGAARTLAQMIVDAILQRDRAARLVQQAMHSGAQLSLSAVVDSLLKATIREPSPPSAKHAALQRVAQRAVIDRLILLAADTAASPESRAMADLKLTELRPVAVARSRAGSPEDRAHWLAIATDFAQWLDRREIPKSTRALLAPPGDPF